MTCIVGFISKDRIYMGGDSAATDDTYTEIRRDPKVFQKGPFIIGFTSSFRMGQILMSSNFKPPKQKKGQSDYDYMITSFIDSIRKTFKKCGYLGRYEEGDERGGVFLIGYKNKLYEIEEDFQVGETYHSYKAVGCGKRVALGAMSILVENDLITPEEKIKKALQSATLFSVGVAPPFNIISMKI
jgi:ATP-dependent protease HslVU (ClpYQ) peptidase subunit